MRIAPRAKAFDISGMGIISAVFYLVFTLISPNLLSALIGSIGLMIAFYYGLTGLASAWLFRHRLRAGIRAALRTVILPLLGALLLFASFVRTAIDLLDPESGDTTLLGVGGAFVYGVGSILLGVVLMIIYNIVSPDYFRGGTLPGDEVTARR